MKLYGYIIEIRYNLFNNQGVTGWEQHFNYKIYKSEKYAQEAIDQMKKTGIYFRNDFRLRQVYINIEE